MSGPSAASSAPGDHEGAEREPAGVDAPQRSGFAILGGRQATRDRSCVRLVMMPTATASTTAARMMSTSTSSTRPPSQVEGLLIGEVGDALRRSIPR